MRDKGKKLAVLVLSAMCAMTQALPACEGGQGGSQSFLRAGERCVRERERTLRGYAG